ncbi:hypothetical protein Hypma_016615 [Hypsizygus marmoreus]|uniref:F-box domain-containing protein n=1 Tax=Hypsizygus marmoreus TaxID=39966 RepID=A0A369J283_HYPMA|nr:hypothetical protein Hypma_016615 [Hypsizygus marmoreus]
MAMAIPIACSESFDRSVSSLSSICSSISTTTCDSADVHHAKSVLVSLRTLQSKLENLAIAEQSVHHYNILLNQKIKVEKCIHDIESIISPARWLPYELIGEILHHYLSSEQIVHLPVLEQHPNPFVFTHICQRWRRVALTTPKVWASLRIEIPQRFKGGYDRRIAGLIDLCTQRSGIRSLDIQFIVFPMLTAWPRCELQEDICPMGVRTIFFALLRHSHRWRELHIDTSFPVLRTIFRGSPISTMLPTPLLEVFDLKGGTFPDDFHGRDHFPRPSLNLSSATSLRKVSLRDNGLYTAHSASFPWRLLEDLSLVGAQWDPALSFQDCLGILRQCTGLKHCRISITEKAHAATTLNAPMIVMDTLQSLHITEHTVPDGVGDLYRFVACPNLQQLTFQFLILDSEELDSQDLSRIAGSITEFLEGSPLITALHLWNIPVSERGLLEMLSRVPLTTHLTLATWGVLGGIGNQLLYEMTVRSPSDSRVLLRRLEYVHIASRGHSEHFLFNFIQSRWRPSTRVQRLKEIRLDLLGNLSANRMHCRLRKFRDEGLKLTIIDN